MIHSPETLRFILEHRHDDVRQLALQAHRYPGVDDMAWAVTQIKGRQIAEQKVPSWSSVDGVLYPRHLSMEQCSSEVTARYKATLVSGGVLADCTGGWGVDSFFMAKKFRSLIYVERQEELCCLAQHNFSLLGLKNVQVIHAEAEQFLEQMQPVDCLFLDPARRDSKGGKTVAIADCTPDVGLLAPLLLQKAPRVLVKLSPMLDLSLALKDLPQTKEVHVVAVDNECKELLLLLEPHSQSDCIIHTVNLLKNGTLQYFSFTREKEMASSCVYTSELKPYLYEPNAGVLKAGAYRSLAVAYGVQKLHPNSHLYTADKLIPDFPGRVFRCQDVIPFQKRSLKDRLADLSSANLTVRNFPASVAELRKRLKLAEGGDTYLFSTTLYNEQRVLLRCVKAG